MEECTVCFEEGQDFMFYNCGHKLCTPCYHKIDNCPLCQSGKIEVVIIQPSAVSSLPNYPIRSLLCFGLSTLLFLYFVVAINSTFIH